MIQSPEIVGGFSSALSDMQILLAWRKFKESTNKV